MRIIGVLVLGFALSSCATFNNPLNRTQLLNTESAYGLALSGAVAYRGLCAKKQIPSTCRDIVLRMQSADRRVRVAIRDARVFIKNNPTLNAATVLIAVQNAISDFRSIVDQNRVN